MVLKVMVLMVAALMVTTLVVMTLESMTSLPLAVHAQPAPPDPSAQLLEMEKLSWVVGTWEGEGWIVMGPGKREEFRGTETVESRLGGLVLVTEGKFVSPESGADVHFALGVLSWDPTAGTYRLRSFLANGRAGDSKGRLVDGVFTWGPPAPPGIEIRYRMRRDEAGRWVETGEMSRDDGKTWNQFFQMTLTKKSG